MSIPLDHEVLEAVLQEAEHKLRASTERLRTRQTPEAWHDFRREGRRLIRLHQLILRLRENRNRG